MSNTFNQQLTHPELLSKENIIEILKTRCIEMPDTKLMSKEELLNIFRRIALPLPQREYSETSFLGKKMTSLRSKYSVPVASFETNKDLEKLTQQSVLNGNTNFKFSTVKSKSSFQDDYPSKKLCLLNNKSLTEINNKRKICESINNISPSKQKRQKITWP